MRHTRTAALIFAAVCMVAASAGLSDLSTWESGRSMRATSGRWNPDMYSGRNNGDNIGTIKAGETEVLADLEGPGIITHIWLTFVIEPHRWAREGAAGPQDMLIRMTWDGREHPDVEVPLGNFFANCFNQRMEVISLPVVVEDADSYNCFWQMPFRKSAKIEVVNQHATKPIKLLYYNVDWIKKDKLPTDTMYFCARYRQEYPAANGKDFLLLDTEGPGHYVGTVMAVRTRSPSWFGEGDEKIYLNGEEQPSIRGTGTEDYFLSAWALKENLTPYFGTPHLSQSMRVIGQKTCSYRWHIEDPIVFEDSIRVTFEHFGWMSADENKAHRPHSWNEREDDVSTVAFWYQKGPSKPFAPSTTAAERRLPSLDRVIVSASEYAAGRYHGRGQARGQNNSRLELHGQLLFKPVSEDEGWVEIPFEVEEKEPLRLLFVANTADDYGIWQPYVDGVKVGDPVDLYSEGSETREVHILDFWPQPGKHTFRLQAVGQNKASGGMALGLESVRLRERRPRVKELGWDKDKNWKEDPMVYR